MTDLQIETIDSAVEHEQIVHVSDAACGLNAFIAIHSTALGPACGGCRLWSYQSSSDGLADALRLARGMTFKNALAGLRFGGGKSVILGPIPKDRRERVFQAFGEAIEYLEGRYITAEDVGVGVKDMQLVSGQTRYVSGLRDRGAGIGGDPSPFTARGVLRGIEAAVRFKLERDNLDGTTIAVQGLGSVGEKLCMSLLEQGANLLISDIDIKKAQEFCASNGAKYVDPKEIILSETDVLAPCALGGAITEKVAMQIPARIVAGAANNQLASPLVGELLHKRGVLYAPDYLINAGGIIMAEAEYYQSDTEPGVLARTDAIHERSLSLFERAYKEDKPPHLIADQMANDIIDGI